jgi:hypothetical protein
MMDGIGGAVALGLDGFVTCLALGVLTPERRRAPLALAFGLCDAAASACAALFGPLSPRAFGAEWPGACALAIAVCAASFALGAARPPEPRRGMGAVAVLPLLASVDNLCTRAGASGAELLAQALWLGAVSAALAFAGLRAGARLKHARWGLSAARNLP